ncbi:MAG TPA: tyrosine decarboxylase MfnA [Methanocorpusculum sp.]|nr:tyrosine decarboxylase MfnA [Methanocorpusculum sp.]
MDEKGLTKEEVIAHLSGFRLKDTPSDHILSTMCAYPNEIVKDIHTMFAPTNLGDPGLYPGTAEIEERFIQELGELLHSKTAGGYATSGGTESNLQAIRIAKKCKKVEKPNIVVPASAHFSFEKTCDVLGIEMRIAPYAKGKYTVDTNEMAELVDKNTIAVCAVAGTTEYGVVDDVPSVAKIAVENNTFCHVDAAFGGFVIPFLEQTIPFDFAIDGVSSISLDPHKMGGSSIPCGCLLLKDAEELNVLSVDTPYLTVKSEFTLSGTRPGADVAGAYAILKYLGKDGFRDIVAGCMENTRRLVEGMEAFGYHRVIDPVLNLATFENGEIPKGWKVSHTRNNHLRFVLMPHVTHDVIEDFLIAVSNLQRS